MEVKKQVMWSCKRIEDEKNEKHTQLIQMYRPKQFKSRKGRVQWMTQTSWERIAEQAKSLLFLFF